MTYFRKLSPVETTYLATDTHESSPFVNQFLLEGRGSIDPVDFQKAVDEACIQNPGIKVKLKGRWGWRYWDTQAEPPRVSFFESDWQLENSFNANLCPIPLSEPINVRDAVNSSISLVKLNTPVTSSSTSNDVNFKILIRVHHGICDAMGMMHFMREIFSALRGESLVGAKGSKSELDIVNSTEYPPVEVFRGNCTSVRTPIPSKGQDPSDTEGCEWVKFRWQGSSNKLLPQLIFIVNNIVREQTKEQRVVFRISSDLRRYLTKEEKEKIHISNLSGAFDLEFKENDSVESIHKSIIRSMRKKLDISVYPKNIKYGPWLPKFLFKPNKKIVAGMHQRSSYGLTGMIGHLGKINTERYSCASFTASGYYAIPIPLDDRSVYMGIFPDEKATNFILSMPRVLADLEGMKSLIDEVKRRLDQL